MVATAPMKSVASFRVGRSAPDLAYFRQRYPETVANLGVLPRREEWLRRIWELETRWQSTRLKSSDASVSHAGIGWDTSTTSAARAGRCTCLNPSETWIA